MNHGSLFSGIGGFDLAASWMGWENIFHCEWNEFGQKVLKHHFPNSISYGDITKTDFTIHRGQIDILSGGFPCQPYSSAGLRKGKEDDRHLWPEMLRAIREIQPIWVVGENVRGLTNWNGGLVFDEIQADLEAEGYECQAFMVPACGVNAPHRRDRIWIVAHANRSNDGGTSRRYEGEGSEERIQKRNKVRKSGESGEVFGAIPHSNDKGLERLLSKRGENDWPISKKRQPRDSPNGGRNMWLNFPTQPPVCGGDDGIPRELDAISFPKWRNESIKAYGNAIVPQVALQIFKAIQQYENL